MFERSVDVRDWCDEKFKKVSVFICNTIFNIMSMVISYAQLRRQRVIDITLWTEPFLPSWLCTTPYLVWKLTGPLCRIYTVLWWNSGLCEIMLGGSWLAAAKLNGQCPVRWFTTLVSGCQVLTLSEPWTAPASWKERSKVPPFLPNRWNSRHGIFSYARTDCNYGALISMHLLF